MSDLICRRTMRRCDTSGMCSPYGGCQPAHSAKEKLESLTEKDFKIITLEATVAQQAQMIEHLRGGPTPGYTAVDMTTAAAQGFRDGAASRDAEIEALRKALTTIREESHDIGACECAADALADTAVMSVSEEKSKAISKRGRDALVDAMSKEG